MVGNQLLRNVVVAVTALMLSGCLAEKMARRAVEREALAKHTSEQVLAGQSCCGSYKEFAFSAIDVDTRVEVVLSSSSPIYEFPFGKTRFQAFELPALGSGDILKFYALELISGADAKPIFRPSIILLAGDHEPLADQPILEYSDRYMGWSQEGHSAKLAISGEYKDAKYLIVAADPSFFGKSYISGAQTYLASAGTIFIPISVPEKHFPYGYEGTAFVEIKRTPR